MLSQGRRPLHYAAEQGDVEVVQRLLATKAAVEAEDGLFRRESRSAVGETPQAPAAEVKGLEKGKVQTYISLGP